MKTAYRTLCDSPAPTAACVCKLSFSENPCIATVSGQKLLIYSYVNQKLALVYEKRYWANLFQVFPHKVKGYQYDFLILGCDTNKVIVLENKNFTLVEIEFHSFDVEYDDEPTRLRFPPKMVIDQNDTCICLLTSGRYLLFLPLLTGKGIVTRPKALFGQHSDWKFIQGCILQDLQTDFKPGIFRVRDIEFLEGYNRPTIAVLHEPIPTWSVRLPQQHSTVCVALISPTLIQRERTQLDDQRVASGKVSWKSLPMPHNSFKVVAVPNGGFLVLSKNAILYVTYTSGITYGLNQLAVLDEECPFKITEMASQTCELYNDVICRLDDRHFLLTVGRSNLSILSLHDNGIDINAMSLYIDTSMELYPSCIVKYADDMIFCGSVIHDSYLYHLEISYEDSEDTFINNPFDGNVQQEELYRKIFQEIPTPEVRHLVDSFSLIERARIYQLGTVSCATPFVNASDGEGNDESLSFALGCGFKSYGCLQFLRVGLHPTVTRVIEHSYPDVESIFYSFNLNHLLVSTKESTTIIDPYSFEKVELLSGIVTEESTIFAQDFGSFFIQVTKRGARVIFSDSFEQILRCQKDITSARINNNHLIILEKDARPHVWELSDDGTGLSKLPSPQISNLTRISIYKSYLFGLRSNNYLCVYDISNGQEVASYNQMRLFPEIVLPNLPNAPVVSGESVAVSDMNIIPLDQIYILVMLLVDGSTIMYKIIENGKGNLVFRRFNVRVVGRKDDTPRAIYSFSDVSGINGGFITGSRPCFILSENGYPRLVPASPTTYSVRCFAQYSDRQFLYSDGNDLRICNFSSRSWQLIDGCPVQRVEIYKTPRYIEFAPSWKSIVLLTSKPEPFTHDDELLVDNETTLTPHYQRPPTPARDIPPDGLPHNTEERYEINVITETMILDPTKSIKLGRHEYAYCLSFIHTSDNYQNEKSNYSEYLAVGTGYMCDDERLMRGRLYIYKGINSTDAAGQHTVTLQELFGSKKVMAAPVTAITEMEGYIACFIGSQLQTYMFLNEDSIKESSFIAGHLFCNCIQNIKNYLLFVDVYRGYEIMRYRRYGNKLIPMARDMLTYVPLTGSFLARGHLLGGVVMDDAGNAQIFDLDEYAIPMDAFVVRSVFHIGCRALSSGKLPIRNSTSRTADSGIAGYMSWFVSDHGKIGTFMPFEDEMSRIKLGTVQQTFEKNCHGFSHVAYRSMKSKMINNQELLNKTPLLIVDYDFLLELLNTQSDIQKQCVKINSMTTKDMMDLMHQISQPVSIFE